MPVHKQIANATYTPLEWGRNKPGMSPDISIQESNEKDARLAWELSRKKAIESAEVLANLKVHKELANRVLAPYIWVHGLLTATEWDNFLKLRCSDETQYDTRLVATSIRDQLEASSPIETKTHLPFIKPTEFTTYSDKDFLAKISAARCARISYLNHDGTTDVKKDLELANRLLDNGHLSPWEHACIFWENGKPYANLRGGWRSFRNILRPN